MFRVAAPTGTSSPMSFPRAENAANATMSPAASSPAGNHVYVKRQRLILDGGSLNNSSFNRSSSLSSSLSSRSFSQSMNGSILRSKDITNSSFYPGKTAYGGISSRRNFTLPTASPYKRVDFQRKKIPSSNKETKSAVPSKAAKIILKSLNQTGFNSADVSKQKKADLFNPALYLRRKSAVHPSTVAPSDSIGDKQKDVPPRTSLQQMSSVKVIPNLFKPARLTQSSVEVKSLAPSTGGKVKRDKSHGHYSSKVTAEDEPVEVPQLSTNFVLPINTSAQFNFGLMKPSNAPLSIGSTAQSSAEASDNVSAFTFRQPDSLSFTAAPVLSPSVPEKFIFSSPLTVGDQSKLLFNSTPKFFKELKKSCESSPGGKILNPDAPAFVPKTVNSALDQKLKSDAHLVPNSQEMLKSTKSATSGVGDPLDSTAGSTFPSPSKCKCECCLFLIVPVL